MSVPKIRPLGDKVLVERLEADNKTKGGIVLPDTAKEKPKEGRVIAVGEGKVLDNGERVKPLLKKGDRVLFTSYSGNEVKLGDKEFVIMSEDDILGVVEEEAVAGRK
ncbi:MAG: co-chaperone GroES [Planctomycetota bacterium]